MSIKNEKLRAYNKEYFKKYYQANKDKIKFSAALWDINNPEKVRVSKKKWQENNKDYVSKKAKEKYSLNKDNILQRQKERYYENIQATREKYRRYYYKNKSKILVRYTENRNNLFEILGGKKCIKCGFADERVLQFDHINGGGTEERKKFGGRLIYFYLKDPNIKDKLQVLCANCNWIKRHSEIKRM